MAVHYRTQGIILKKRDWKESDQLLTAYTKDFGKLEILGKAIRKIISKLRGDTSLFSLSEIEFIQGRSHQTLTDALSQNTFANIRNDLRKFRIVQKIAAMTDNLVAKEEKDEQIWLLLNEVFEKLNNAELKINNLQLIYYYFFWNLAAIIGYKPEIRNNSIDGIVLNNDIAKILKIILNKDWHILVRLRITPVHLKLLRNVSVWYNKKIIS